MRSNNLQALCLLPASVSPFAPLGMSGLSELADTGFVYESGRVNAGVGNHVYELGPDGQLRVVFTLYSIICQTWKQWSLGDPEGGDVEQEVSELHGGCVPGAGLSLSEELNPMRSPCSIPSKTMAEISVI